MRGCEVECVCVCFIVACKDFPFGIVRPATNKIQTQTESEEAQGVPG